MGYKKKRLHNLIKAKILSELQLIQFHLAMSASTQVYKHIFDPVSTNEDLPTDVGLLEVRSHADGLPIELVGFLQTGVIRPN